MGSTRSFRSEDVFFLEITMILGKKYGNTRSIRSEDIKLYSSLKLKNCYLELTSDEKKIQKNFFLTHQLKSLAITVIFGASSFE